MFEFLNSVSDLLWPWVILIFISGTVASLLNLLRVIVTRNNVLATMEATDTRPSVDKWHRLSDHVEVKAYKEPTLQKGIPENCFALTRDGSTYCAGGANKPDVIALIRITALLAACLLPTAAFAQHTRSENFLVSTQTVQEDADYVLILAEKLRKEISLDWFGKELEVGRARTLVSCHKGEDESALFWGRVSDLDPLHNIYVRSPDPVDGVNKMLPHEMVHMVFTAHGRHIPWLIEGIACTYDDEERKKIRRDALEYHGRGRDITKDARPLHRADTLGYATAESIVEYLLTKYSKEEIGKFGMYVPVDLYQDWERWYETTRIKAIK